MPAACVPPCSRRRGRKPFLGICIGLQMLFERSEEGDTPGLGLLPGRVRRFPAERMVGADGRKLKVPHMGWNEVHQTRAHPLWSGIAPEAPLLLRAQLLRGAGRSGPDRGDHPLPVPVYQCGRRV